MKQAVSLICHQSGVPRQLKKMNRLETFNIDIRNLNGFLPEYIMAIKINHTIKQGGGGGKAEPRKQYNSI